METDTVAGRHFARPTFVNPYDYPVRRSRLPRIEATPVAPVIRKPRIVDNVVQFPPIPVGGEWEVQPYWLGETVFVVASGPSIKKVNFELIRGRKIICVNASIDVVPWASMVFFGDGRLWAEHKKRWVTLPGHVVTCSGLVTSKRVLRINRLKPISPTTGYSESRKGVASQRTSLQGAMNLAAHLNSNDKIKGRIVLIGADMARDPVTGESHGHKPHKWPNRPGNVVWDEQMRHLKWIAAPLQRKGIEVINTSMGSRIPWWPKMPLEVFLAQEKAAT